MHSNWEVDSHLNGFFEIYLGRLVQESIGAVSSVRSGTHFALFHCGRGIIESFGGLTHLLEENDQIDLKLEKWRGFDDLKKYKHFSRVLKLLDRGLSDVNCRRAYACDRMGAEMEIALINKATKERWLELYRPGNKSKPIERQLRSISYWHSPKLVRDILDDSLPRLFQGDDGAVIDGISKLYNDLSNFTHPSVFNGTYFCGPEWSHQIGSEGLRDSVESLLAVIRAIQLKSVALIEDRTGVDTRFWSKPF